MCGTGTPATASTPTTPDPPAPEVSRVTLGTEQLMVWGNQQQSKIAGKTGTISY